MRCVKQPRRLEMKIQVANTLRKIKDHLKRNEVTYVVGGIAVCAIILQQRNLHSFYKFLNEKGIDPMEYYCPEAFEELRNNWSKKEKAHKPYPFFAYLTRIIMKLLSKESNEHHNQHQEGDGLCSTTSWCHFSCCDRRSGKSQASEAHQFVEQLPRPKGIVWGVLRLQLVVEGSTARSFLFKTRRIYTSYNERKIIRC